MEGVSVQFPLLFTYVTKGNRITLIFYCLLGIFYFFMSLSPCFIAYQFSLTTVLSFFGFTPHFHRLQIIELNIVVQFLRFSCLGDLMVSHVSMWYLQDIQFRLYKCVGFQYTHSVVGINDMVPGVRLVRDHAFWPLEFAVGTKS